MCVMVRESRTTVLSLLESSRNAIRMSPPRRIRSRKKSSPSCRAMLPSVSVRNFAPFSPLFGCCVHHSSAPSPARWSGSASRLLDAWHGLLSHGGHRAGHLLRDCVGFLPHIAVGLPGESVSSSRACFSAAWLLPSVGLFLTGCFHEDGLADSADGIGKRLKTIISIKINCN